MSVTNDLINVVSLDDLENLQLSNEPTLLKTSEYYNIKMFSKIVSTNHSNSLSIMNCNARSPPKHISEYQLLFSSLSTDTWKSFDVLSFTETCLNETLESLATLEGYCSIFKHKSSTKAGGGLAFSFTSPSLSLNALIL